MKVRVVLSRNNSTWVIGKMAARLVGELVRAGVDATLDENPDDAADINHWMSYAFVGRRAGRASTVLITHIDDPYKARLLKDMLDERVDLGVCVSRDMMRMLVEWHVPRDRLWYVLPALDAPPEPARIRIAIATRLYDDGRKRENFLVRLAAESDLSAFHFEIAGTGWDAVVPKLHAAGATVHWVSGGADYQADYAAMLEAMRSCEYYLYLGMDEGSLGTLDALALGLKTIVTPQGFHLDLPGGITEPVETWEEFRDTMLRLAHERELRIASVRDWTWAEFARDYIRIWDLLLQGRREEIPEQLGGHGRYDHTAAPSLERGRSSNEYYARLLSPRRMLGALARMRWLQPLRRTLRR